MAVFRVLFGKGNVWFFVGLVIVLVIGWGIFPQALYSKKMQPVDFSHAKHGLESDLTCESCHAFREDGSYTGIPDTKTCFECHDEVPNSDDPREAQFIDEYVKPGKEIEWLVYSKQPPCVYFSHAPHVKMAKLDCTVCHGPKKEENTPPVYQENRLTKYSRNIWGYNMFPWKSNTWDRMKMNDCADCHEDHGTSNACFVCHK